MGEWRVLPGRAAGTGDTLPEHHATSFDFELYATILSYKVCGIHGIKKKN